MLVKKTSGVPYVLAVAVMASVGVLAAVAITWLRPDHDNMLLIAAVFGFLLPTTTSVLAYMKSQETHLSVNSQLDKWLKAAEANAHSEGLLQGRANERNESKPKRSRKS